MTGVAASELRTPKARTPNAKRREEKYAFGREADMVLSMRDQWARRGVLLENTEAWPSTVYVKREWPLGGRIADLAIFAIREDWDPSTRVMRRIGGLTGTELAVLARLVEIPMSLDQLSQSVFVRAGVLECTVKGLLASELLQEAGESVLRPASEWLPWLPHSLHFLEAKLEDWPEAIAQAAFYRAFADHASVALPATFEQREDVHRACEDAGVGLVLISATGTGQIALGPPKVEASVATRKIQCALQLLRRAVLDSLHGVSIRTATH